MANSETGCSKSIPATKSINYLPQANSFFQSSHIIVKFLNVDSWKNMMIKLKKINHLKAKTRRKVAVLLVSSYYGIPKDSKLKKKMVSNNKQERF